MCCEGKNKEKNTILKSAFISGVNLAHTKDKGECKLAK
jgi:hypothetical protein